MSTNEHSSAALASIAGRILADDNSTAVAKSLAGSVLSQARDKSDQADLAAEIKRIASSPLEWDYRPAPAGFPNHMLITVDELEGLLMQAVQAAAD